jgi:hypothetical protein
MLDGMTLLNPNAGDYRLFVDVQSGASWIKYFHASPPQKRAVGMGLLI